MFIPLAGEEQLFQLLTEIPVIVKYPYDAVLNDVRHKRSVLFVTIPSGFFYNSFCHNCVYSYNCPR